MPSLADTEQKRGFPGRYATPALLSLGALDRAIVIAGFGSRYVSTDDGVIWGAAMHYGRGSFHGPYYYGQNYGPMLEALVAAPFTHLGIPLWWLMPIVTTVLGLLPYWSFALWHQKHGRTAAAACFAALPLLLPVEFSMMTTMSRGFVSGMAPLAFLPWILDLRNAHMRSLLTGTAISAAWYANPNSTIFSAAYLCWYVTTQRPWPKHTLFTALGLLPGALAHMFSQAWCEAHPDRAAYFLDPRALLFERDHFANALSYLDGHFRWLMPVLWPYGSLTLVLLVGQVLLAIRHRKPVWTASLLVALLIITFSLGMWKTHDGEDWVFFPRSRMYLALPLLLAWGGALFVHDLPLKTRGAMIIAVLAVTCTIWRATQLETSIRTQVTARYGTVGIDLVEHFVDDEKRIRGICDERGAGLIVPLQAGGGMWPAFRAYLYPAIDQQLPPTYLERNDRQYWLHDRCASSVVPTILFTGGDPPHWDRIRARDQRFERFSADGYEDVYILPGNTTRTDSLVTWLSNELNEP